MIHINLLPVRELRAEVARRQEIVISSVAIGVTVIVLAGIYFHQSSRVAKAEAELAGLEKEIKALNAKARGIVGLKRKLKTLQEKINIINELGKKKAGPVRVMESLSAATPGKLWLTEFKESGGNLSLNGMAVDNQTIADFIKALSSHVYFQDVELIETTQVEENQSEPLKKFVMQAKLFYWVPPKEPEQKKASGPAEKGRKKE